MTISRFRYAINSVVFLTSKAYCCLFTRKSCLSFKRQLCMQEFCFYNDLDGHVLVSILIAFAIGRE
jgi:hypothetical protein